MPSAYDTEVSFEIFNVGDESGKAAVDLEINNTHMTTWTSSELAPNFGEVGKISVGPLQGGTHEALVYVNPGSGQNDHLSERFSAG